MNRLEVSFLAPYWAFSSSWFFSPAWSCWSPDAHTYSPANFAHRSTIRPTTRKVKVSSFVPHWPVRFLGHQLQRHSQWHNNTSTILILMRLVHWAINRASPLNVHVRRITKVAIHRPLTRVLQALRVLTIISTRKFSTMTSTLSITALVDLCTLTPTPRPRPSRPTPNSVNFAPLVFLYNFLFFKRIHSYATSIKHDLFPSTKHQPSSDRSVFPASRLHTSLSLTTSACSVCDYYLPREQMRISWK